MTLPAWGNPISLGALQTEMGGTNPISLGEYYRGTLENIAGMNSDRLTKTQLGGWALIPQSGTISLSNFYYATAHSSSVLNSQFTTSTTWGETADRRAGLMTMRIYAVGGGGGGGGGSSRYYGWWPYGGGGGGASGEIRYVDVTVYPTDVLTITIGAGGAAGGARDGPYSSGTSGTAGGYTGVQINGGSWSVLSYGGNGGAVSPGAAGVGATGTGVGTLVQAAQSGTASTYYTYIGYDIKGNPSTAYVQNPGGTGAAGTHQNTYSFRNVNWIANSSSAGGIGTAGPGTSTYATAGYLYGGGGGGGGVNVADNYLGMQGAAGYPGFVTIVY